MTPEKLLQTRPLRFSTTRGEMEYLALGDGRPMLTIHGAMGGWDQSALLGLTIAPERRQIAVSRPGYLGSSVDLGGTPEDQARACLLALDHAGVDRTVVAAVSGGGPAAIGLALDHPDRCSALILCSAASGPTRSNIPWWFRYVSRPLVRFPPFARRTRRRIERDPAAAAARSIPDPETRARTLAHPEAGRLMISLMLSAASNPARRMEATWNDIAQVATFAPPLERIAVPTLLIHGTADDIAPFALSKSASERIPAADLLAVEGGRHVTIFTHIDQVRARVEAFLKEHGV